MTRTALRVGALIALALTLTLAACDSASPDLAADELAALRGGQERVDVCHYDADADAFKLITVAAPALAAHLAHGDGRPGEPVPGREGSTFNETCVFEGDPTPVVLWDNGGIVTHPGAGAGGADVSMASMIGGISTTGSNVLLQGANPHFRIADDFTVGEGGWHLGAIVTHAYQTGAAIPTWTGFNANLWDGDPADPGSAIVASTTTASIAFTGVYRVFTGAGNLGNTDRPVYAITWDLSDTFLPEGTYWVDWQVEGGTSAWAPYVMEVNPLDPDNPITVFGNGQQLTLGPVWQPNLQAPGAETPFLVIGSTIGPLTASTLAPSLLRASLTPEASAPFVLQTPSAEANDVQRR